MIGWFQCDAGASGDMLLATLLDAGAPLGDVRSSLDALPVEKVRLSPRRVTRHGVAAMKVDVEVPDSATPRTWPDVRALLESAHLPGPVRERALETFARLARAEAAVHGTQPEEVHFHEVGALDAIADVVGTCAALYSLGVTHAACPGVALGTGVTRGAHGLVPIPAPAVLELLREAQAPVHTTGIPHELCTPTGAALLAATITEWGAMPPMRIRATGTGAGTRELDEVPNTVRVVLGEAVPQATGSRAAGSRAAGTAGVRSGIAGEGQGTAQGHAPQDDAGQDDAGQGDTTAGGAAPAAGSLTEHGMVLMETNVDDLDPRLWPAILEALLDAGAADAWLTPILMKKGRPAHTLAALVAGGAADSVRRAIFAETSTLGIRERRVDRCVLERGTVPVRIGGHEIRVKLAYLEGAVVNAAPEYEDVAAAARALGRPTRSVLVEALAAARAR